MVHTNLNREQDDYEALLEIDAFDHPTNHRAWIISGDMVTNVTNEDYQKFREWVQELGGQVTALSQHESTQGALEDWLGIDVDQNSGVVLLSRPVFDTACKTRKIAKSSIGVAYNTTAYPRNAGPWTDKAKNLPPEIVSTEREGWIRALAPTPGYIDFEVLQYASERGLLLARLEGFGRASQRVIDTVIQYTGAKLATLSSATEQ